MPHVELARTKTESMAERFEASGGGALDNLEGHPEILAATFELEGGGILQKYVRKDYASRTDAASRDWTTVPSGAMHALKGYLALEPLYVSSPVQLGTGVTGTVSVVVDHRWIWGQLCHRIGQVPIALLLGCLVAWVAANLLRRQVAEPLAQLGENTRVDRSAQQGDARKLNRRRNELNELATNFDALANRLVEYERELVSNETFAHRKDAKFADRMVFCLKPLRSRRLGGEYVTIRYR